MHYTFFNYREIQLSKVPEELKWHVFSVSTSFGASLNKAVDQLVSLLVNQYSDMMPESRNSGAREDVSC